MGKLIVNSYSEFEQYAGKELGVSDYHRITQDQINKFADATLDHQWIHLDAERAKKESPYGVTIAHGYLTLSILPYLWNQIIEVNNIKMLVNYGIEKLKFNQPVLVDSEVRVKAKLNSIINLRGITKVEINVVLEIKDNKKPALDASLIFLYHFN
jgi:acyl dehydratase